MILRAYTKNNREAVISSEVAKGNVLMEERNHVNGDWLVFGTQNEHAQKFPTKHTVDEIAVLKEQIATLTTTAKGIETRITSIESKKIDKEIAPLIADITKLKAQITDVTDSVGWLQSKTVVVENKMAAIEEAKSKEGVVKEDLKVKEP